MDESKQRIAIAELCGWTKISLDRRVMYCRFELIGCIPGDSQRLIVPDFLHDLNACREFEEWTRNMGFLRDYGQQLAFVAGVCEPYTEGDLTDVAMLSAKMKCKAFLRMVGKWEE